MCNDFSQKKTHHKLHIYTTNLYTPFPQKNLRGE